MNQLSTQKALISVIKRSKRPVSILVGSPMSAPDQEGGRGVPGVKGILDAIEKHIADVDLVEEYKQAVQTDCDIEKYQESFSFIRNWVSQDDVNEIIKNSVIHARLENDSQGDPAELDKDVDGWYLPAGTKYLGEIVAKSEKISGPILTTNFDPLLSVSISKAGCIPVQTVLNSDGKLGQQRALDSKCRSIVHLHGYWHDSDTLHTPDQLMTERPNLKASLRRLLSERVLLVIGYGGWDDIFLSALSDLIYDERAELDVLWAFYEREDAVVNERYKDLITKVEPAKARGRFRMYGGIDCHAFFPKLFSELKIGGEHDLAKGKEPDVEKEAASSDDGNETDDSILSIASSDVGSSNIGSFKKWEPKASNAHLHIRDIEKELFSDAISKSRVVYLSSDWGMGKEGFIYSLMKAKKPSIPLNHCYKINIEDVADRDEFFKVAEEQLGVEIQVFAVEAAKGQKVTLFIDGVSPSPAGGKDDWVRALNEIVHALIDFAPSLTVVLSGIKKIENLDVPIVSLEPLDEADVYTYIKEHADGGEELSSGRGLEVLYRLSSGLPVSLDTLLSELTILSLDELLESESTNIGDISSEPVPAALERSITNLSEAKDDHQKRSFSLLKVLSVLEFGESLKNVKRFDNSKPFYASHIRELRDLGLITTTSLYRDTPALSDSKVTAEELAKVHSVQPLVRERVLKMIDQGEVKRIVEKSTDIAFGEKWREGQIKLNHSVTEHLQDTSRSGSGNPHLLASQMLRYAVDTGNELEIKRAFKIGLAYCQKLEKFSRYRDLANCSGELISILREVSELVDFPDLLVIHGSALRMQGKEEEAIDILEQALKYNSLSKELVGSANLDLALAFESIGENLSAIEAAKNVQNVFKKGNPKYTQATSIIVETEASESKEAELVQLEQEARKNKNFITANNLAITIADIESDLIKKMALFDRVIAETSDRYNQMRAAMRKGGCLSDLGSLSSLSYQEGKLLIDAYEYGFSQRINPFFNSALKVLWEKYEEEGDAQKLIQLFRYSSLLWRLEGKLSREKEYAEKLSSYMKDEPRRLNSKTVESPIKKYVIVRLRYLSPSRRKKRKK